MDTEQTVANLCMHATADKKVIVFDLHDVLFYRNYYECIKRMWAIKKKVRLLIILLNPRFIFDAFKMLSITRVGEAYIVKLCQRYPPLLAYMHHVIQLMNAITPDVALFELIKKLKENGNKIYILSNIGPSTLQDLTAQYNELFSYFNGIHCVHADNNWLAKPNHNAYLLFLEKFNIDPGQMVFIDDKPKNVIAALELGIDAIRYRSSNHLYERMATKNIL